MSTFFCAILCKDTLIDHINEICEVVVVARQNTFLHTCMHHFHFNNCA